MQVQARMQPVQSRVQVHVQRARSEQSKAPLQVQLQTRMQPVQSRVQVQVQRAQKSR